jgi:hypothetical protein
MAVKEKLMARDIDGNELKIGDRIEIAQEGDRDESFTDLRIQRSITELCSWL